MICRLHFVREGGRGRERRTKGRKGTGEREMKGDWKGDGSGNGRREKERG